MYWAQYGAELVARQTDRQTDRHCMLQECPVQTWHMYRVHLNYSAFQLIFTYLHSVIFSTHPSTLLFALFYYSFRSPLYPFSLCFPVLIVLLPSRLSCSFIFISLFLYAGNIHRGNIHTGNIHTGAQKCNTY